MQNFIKDFPCRPNDNCPPVYFGYSEITINFAPQLKTITKVLINHL
jgi:hypothetical protein